MKTPRFKYYNLLWVFLVLVAAIFLFDYQSILAKEKQEDERRERIHKTRDGLRETFHPNGKIKTRINYDQGIKHGAAALYFKNGSVQLAMTYDRGKRQGESKKYYKNGRLYAVTPYVDDKITGERKLYYDNLQLKAIVPYENSNPGKGLKEYSLTGKVIEHASEITFQRSGTRYYFDYLTGCKKAAFYIGELSATGFFDQKSPLQEALPQYEGRYYVEQAKLQNNAGKKVICKCTTRQGNTLILERSIPL